MLSYYELTAISHPRGFLTTIPSAIVTGVTGIFGREIVSGLGRNTQKWPTVHALSRSKKEDYPSGVIHNHIDLTSSAEEMAKSLKNVKAEYVFFAAYLQKDSEKENREANGSVPFNLLPYPCPPPHPFNTLAPLPRRNA